MLSYRDLQNGQERLADALCEEERKAQRREAQQAHPASANVVTRALANAGGWLVDQGEALQARYGEQDIPVSIDAKREVGVG